MFLSTMAPVLIHYERNVTDILQFKLICCWKLIAELIRMTFYWEGVLHNSPRSNAPRSNAPRSNAPCSNAPYQLYYLQSVPIWVVKKRSFATFFSQIIIQNIKSILIIASLGGILFQFKTIVSQETMISFYTKM